MLGAFSLLLNYTYVGYAIPYLWKEGAEASGTRFQSGNVMQHWEAWLAYPELIWKYRLGAFFSLATIMAVATVLIKPRKAEAVALIYFLGPLFLFTLISKKHYTYVLSMLPACALLIGFSVSRWSNHLAIVALAAILLLGGANYTRHLYSAEPLAPLYDLDFRYFPGTDYRIYIPTEEKFLLEPALNNVKARLQKEKKQRILLAFFGQHNYEENLIRYYLRIVNWGNEMEVIEMKSVEADHEAKGGSFRPELILLHGAHNVSELTTHLGVVPLKDYSMETVRYRTDPIPHWPIDRLDMLWRKDSGEK